ncbi:putative vacuolar import/degradation Vid27 [Helianthus annuus]|uniref:Vacuolar import/degradation Vid27 n=1 Tax=Helianthus annuus TaxID=4232 RepID=A0A9K3N3Y9_HELAN|nr:putative vacuolar import/degradation Vid27 [Helianthus annuus]
MLQRSSGIGEIVPKDDSVVDSRFMHEKFAFSDSPKAPLVVATPLKVSSSSRRLFLCLITGFCLFPNLFSS